MISEQSQSPESATPRIPAHIAKDMRTIRQLDQYQPGAAPDRVLHAAGQALSRIKHSDYLRSTGQNFDDFVSAHFNHMGSSRRAELMTVGDAFTSRQVRHTTLGLSRLHAIAGADEDAHPALLRKAQSAQWTEDQIIKARDIVKGLPKKDVAKALEAHAQGRPIPAARPSRKDRRQAGPGRPISPQEQRMASFLDTATPLERFRMAKLVLDRVAKPGEQDPGDPLTLESRILLQTCIKSLPCESPHWPFGPPAEPPAPVHPDRAQRSGAPSIDRAQQSGAPSIDRRQIVRDTPGAGRGPAPADPPAEHTGDQRPPRAPLPYLLSDADDALPVHDPGFPLSDFELLTSEIIVATAELDRLCQRLMKGRGEPGAGISFLLMLRTQRANARFLSGCEQVRALIQQAAATGLRTLQSQNPAGQPLPLPLYTDFFTVLPPDFHPLSWVTVLVRDPIDEPYPDRLEPLVWRLLGVLDALHPRLGRWLALRRAGANADTPLLYQLDQVMRGAHTELYCVQAEFQDGAAQGELLEQEQGCTGARLEVAAELPKDPNLVILGSDEMVSAYARLGLDQQGRHLALSLFTSQLVLALGGRGFGKSHLGRLIAECLHLYLKGVSSLPQALRSATFELDCNLGQGRRQMLRGFYPNGNPQQLQQLHAYYGSTVSNAAFRHGILRCFVPSLDGLRAELAAYIERGLIIEPLELGPQNLGQIGWEAILGSAFQQGADRPRYADHLAALIGTWGDELTPELLIGAIQDGKEFARVRDGLINQLRPLCGLVRPGAELRQDLNYRCPVFYLLETQHAPESFLLGLLVAVMHGLMRPTGRPEDQIMLWLFCDELSKLMDLPVVGKLLLAMAKELRHRKVSLCLGGQTATNLPSDFLGLVSVLFLLHLSSRAGFRPLQELEYFRSVSYEQVMALLRGQALVGAVHCTDPLLRQMAQWIWLRPTFIDAGGESLTL